MPKPATAVPNAPEQKQVPIVDEDGSVSLVDRKDVAAVQREGARLATPEEYKAAQNEEKYGGVGGALKAAGAGALRGATVGLSDPLLVEGTKLFSRDAGEELRQGMEARKELFPTLSTASELAGAVAPALLSGGSAAAVEGAEVAGSLGRVAAGARTAARAVSAPMEAVATAGRGVEHLVSRAVKSALGPGSEGFLARVAERALPQAAGTATEGALFGLGNAVSEATLEDEPLTAEKLMAGVGHGALIGGALGGAMGVGSTALDAALKKSGEVFAPLMKEALGDGTFQGMSEGFAWKSLRPSLKYEKAAERIEGGVQGIGGYLRKELPEVLEGKSFAKLDAEDFQHGTHALVEKEGQKLSALIDELDAKATVKPSVQNIVTRVETDVLKRLETTPGAKGVANQVRDYLSELAPTLGENPGFRQLRDARSFLDDKIYGETLNGVTSVTGKELQKVRGAIEGELESAIDKGGAELGATFLKDYKSAKLDYSRAKIASKAAEDRFSRDQANRFVSPSDYGAGLGTLAALGGNPLGAVGSVAATAANHFLRKQGNQIASEVLDKLARVTAVQRVANQVDQQVDHSLDTFFNKASKGSKASLVENSVTYDTPKGGLKERYTVASEAIAAAAGSPESHTRLIAPKLSTLQKHTPSLADNVALNSARATNFLASKIPARPTKGVFGQPSKLSDAEMSKFMRYFSGVDRPLSVVNDMQNGKISREGVEALKAVYPRIYEELQGKVYDRIMEAGDTVPYQKRVQLGLLLNIPADASLEPAFIKEMQATFAGQSQEQRNNPGSSPAPKRPIDVAKFTLTETQALTGR